MGENMSIEIPIDIVKAEHGEATHRTKGACPWCAQRGLSLM